MSDIQAAQPAIPAPAPPVHAPMSQFKTDGTQLLINQVPVTHLAARVGRTPFYAYDRSLFSERVAALRSAMPPKLRLNYAIKANPMPAVVQHFVRAIDGFDVASVGEMAVALDAGMSPQHISFAGPGKTDAELRQAVAAGILVHVESARELPVLHEAAQQLGLPARVAVRVNPDFELKSSGMKMGGGPKQFGVDADLVPALLADIRRKDLAFEGFHLFAGSQNLQAASVVEAQIKSYELAVRLSEHAPSPITHLNLGGGLGIPYFPGDKRLDLVPIAANLAQLIERAQQELPQARLTVEMGRYLVGEAGVYVCRVIDRKVSRGQVFLVTDGGMHHHLAASGNFGQIIRKNYPVCVANRMNEAAIESAHIVGPLCTPLDILGERCLLPRAEAGDLIAVYQSGAYGATASPQRFLSHPQVAEVLV